MWYICSAQHRCRWRGKLLLLTCMSVALLIRLAAESAWSCVNCCLPTSLLRLLLVVAMLRSRAAECMSHNITSSPFMAASCAMPPPICPAIGIPRDVICANRRNVWTRYITGGRALCTPASYNMVMTAPAPRTPKSRGKVVDILWDIDGVLAICAGPTSLL